MLDRVFRRSPGTSATPSGEPVIDTQRPAPEPARRGVALALGGGAARGWSHIGVLRALDEARIPVSMIAGTSIGALVGGCYLAGRLDELERFALSLTRRGMMRFMDFQFGGGGLFGGERLNRRLVAQLADVCIEDLDRPLVCVATEARSGHEVWIDQGSLVLAMRASYALPGVFRPVECAKRRLFDGAMVNPVPVSVCRAFEQPLVIAVNLNHDLFGRAAVLRLRASGETPAALLEANRADPLIGTQTRGGVREKIGIARSMVDAFQIIQDRISRSRLAGDPPDLSIYPRVRDIGLAEFYRAEECIRFGYDETVRNLPEIRRLCETALPA